LVVQWQMRDDELAWICKAYQSLKAAVGKSGFGVLKLDSYLADAVRRAFVPQGGHHIGTVRMGADPRAGVVDQNGELWGTHRLFVAGTAIFPTSGFANPTLTAVALAFRLAEHLIQPK
jgi:choline dehydrogenase-like flavoprotein